jgi:hypothetical protein
MALDATQILDFRADIGDETSPYAFSDTELDRLYDRCENSYDRAVILAIEQLLANAVKFYSYTAGYTKAEQDKIYDHLKNFLELKKSRGNQAHIIGVSIVPPNVKVEPNA